MSHPYEIETETYQVKHDYQAQPQKGGSNAGLICPYLVPGSSNLVRASPLMLRRRGLVLFPTLSTLYTLDLPHANL